MSISDIYELLTIFCTDMGPEKILYLTGLSLPAMNISFERPFKMTNIATSLYLQHSVFSNKEVTS